MKALIVSHKPCWMVEGRPATDGGFPSQIHALASLFDSTTLVACAARRPRPAGLRPVEHPRLEVVLVPEPYALGFARKLLLPFWLAVHGAVLIRRVAQADLVHALVPGDLGLLGAFAARLLSRPLVVRHCGTWGHRGTYADRFLTWWLPRLARKGGVVFATGGDDHPPEPVGPRLHWIFSTALSADALQAIEPAVPWRPGVPLRLITVGRLTAGKNQAAAIESLRLLRDTYPDATLEVLGDGPARGQLAALVEQLGLGEAVVLRGNVGRAEVISSLQGSHLFLFPTRVAEGFPKAVLEALACGVPVVASPVSVVPRLLAEGGGRVLEATDPHTVAEAVRAMLAEPSRLTEAGQAGRRTASRYTLERWRDEIGSAIEQAWGPLRDPARALE